MGNAVSGGGVVMSFADKEMATAATKGNLQRVRFLLEKDGANVNLQDQFGWSPLMHAISEGHLDVIKYLVSKGAITTHVTADRANAIHHAVVSQNDAVLAFILQYNTCDVNAQNDNGWTPLHLACLANQQSAARILLTSKADASIENNDGKTAADLTTSPSIRKLLKEGPSSQSEDIEEETELYQNRGMTKSLQRLQEIKNPPAQPVAMKGYVYLNDQHDSTDDLVAITTVASDDTRNTTTSTSNNNNNNNNNTGESSVRQRMRERAMGGGDGLVEREFQRIFDAINTLRGIDPDNLSLVQVQELIDFHNNEMQKYLAAKKIMEEIRARELDLLLTN